MEDNSRREREGHRVDRGTRDGQNPRVRQRSRRSPRAVEGGRTVTGNISRLRQEVRGAGMSDGGWQVVGGGDVKMGGALCRERRWGAGANGDRDLKMNRY